VWQSLYSALLWRRGECTYLNSTSMKYCAELLRFRVYSELECLLDRDKFITVSFQLFRLVIQLSIIQLVILNFEIRVDYKYKLVIVSKRCLFVRRGKQPSLGQWTLPGLGWSCLSWLFNFLTSFYISFCTGGSLNFGESLFDCGKREIEEETGLKVAFCVY
jgi:hypothetical protein